MDCLTSYRALSQALPLLNETDLYQLILRELRNDKRPSMILRLHRRYCVLRAHREREALLGANEHGNW